MFYMVPHASPLSEWVEGEVIIDVFTSSTGVEDYTIEVTPVEDTVLRYSGSWSCDFDIP